MTDAVTLPRCASLCGLASPANALAETLPVPKKVFIDMLLSFDVSFAGAVPVGIFDALSIQWKGETDD